MLPDPTRLYRKRNKGERGENPEKTVFLQESRIGVTTLLTAFDSTIHDQEAGYVESDWPRKMFGPAPYIYLRRSILIAPDLAPIGRRGLDHVATSGHTLVHRSKDENWWYSCVVRHFTAKSPPPKLPVNCTVPEVPL